MTEDVKASGKNIPTTKKAEPKKAGNARSGQQLEEITDNRPREILYERDFTVDSGEAIEVTEDVAHIFSKSFMTIQIFEINKENEKEKLSETIKLDLSCFLFPKENVNVS